MQPQASEDIPARLPATVELLTAGGDARILCLSGNNEYGCRPCPDPGLISFASSTASTLSESGFAAADALRRKIINEPNGATACDREFGRIREEFASLCGLADFGRQDILFAASGTDTHLIASRLLAPGHILMVAQSETGKGVPAALAGRHFSTRSAYSAGLARGEVLDGGMPTPVSEIGIRNADGSPRDGCAIDQEISDRVGAYVKRGGRVLLVLADVSKTGMIAPSLACALKLKAAFSDSIDILVDACQFRMAPSTLRAYLDKGFLVAVTGSKFLTGPAFSGALFIPQTVRRLRGPKTLAAYSSRFEWPSGMRPGFAGTGTNFGLLLRWEAALAEFRAFHAVPETEVEKFLLLFAGTIRHRLETDPSFEPLTVPPLDRLALTGTTSWDHIQTIFPFRLKKNGRHLSHSETCRIHALLQEDLSPLSPHPAAALRCSLGQPVSCGAEGGALRLCASARLVVEGLNDPAAVLDRAAAVLDKAVLLLEFVQDA